MTLSQQFQEYVRGEKLTDVTIPTGSTLLDLVISDAGGVKNGWIYNIIGDSSAGKTFLACELIAAAKHQLEKEFNVKVAYNDCESGFNFDTEALYGFDIREDVRHSQTVQDFFTDFQMEMDDLKIADGKKIKKDDFLIYIVDSFDGLSSDEVETEMDERKTLAAKGEKYAKGSYDMVKQKHASKSFAYLSTELDARNVILIIVSQIRDNVGSSYGRKWKVSGGNALRFYSSVQIFLRRIDTYEKTVMGHVRDVGYTLCAEGIKVRSKTPYRKCNINILYEYGVDDISSNIDFLFDLRTDTGKLKADASKNLKWDENKSSDNDEEEIEYEDVTAKTLAQFLKDTGMLDAFNDTKERKTIKNINAYIMSVPELDAPFKEKFGSTMSRDQLIAYIENEGLNDVLVKRVQKKWQDIEDAVRPVRRGKYQ